MRVLGIEEFRDLGIEESRDWGIGELGDSGIRCLILAMRFALCSMHVQQPVTRNSQPVTRILKPITMELSV